MIATEIATLIGATVGFIGVLVLLSQQRLQREKTRLEIDKLRLELTKMSIEVDNNYNLMAKVVRQESADASLTSGEPLATIETPMEGAFVGHSVPMEGTIHNLPNDKELWIIKEISHNNFHPDRGPVFVKNEHWWGTAYVGNNTSGADTGMPFTVHLVLANSDAASKYNAYIENAYRTGRWSGIDSLFGGKVLSTLRVVRDDANVLSS